MSIQEIPDCQQNHIEQLFLNNLLNKKQVVQIYLATGIKMVGTILGSDEFTILLSTKTFGLQMFYKHAITTISAHNGDK